ncbi:hypothetical protein QU577_26775 [Priestia megaterium]|uniref:hypothetical protein n=1 Tax=Priestia megaterium TaxID=1404 RepID=UPI0025AFC026|nr:hypothetical protein [Priestia megaterium]MDN3365370.1 hypothetical protein [Priestia megaterium]
MKMTIKDTNNMDQLSKNLKKLNKTSIKVGVFGSDDAELVKIASVHEYGMTIRPKKAKMLAIPVSPKAKGKRPADFPTLFNPKGTKVLAIPKGKDDMEVLFVLMHSVTIPERSFIRAGYDENIDAISNKVADLVPPVIAGNVPFDAFADMVGLELAGKIQKKLRSISDPANSPTTQTVKRSSNPLIDTGRLVGAIRHEVVE